MLSEQLDALPYPKRIPALLDLLRAEAEPQTRIAELASGGPHERFLAVTAAAALGLRPVVVQTVRDPDSSVRAEAVKHALRQGWTTGGELLADAPPVLRHLILRLLRRHPGSGDELIDEVRQRYGDREAAALLPACTAATVTRLLPGLARSIGSWKVLARRHSAAILDWAEAGLAGTPEPDWAPFETAVAACTGTAPARVLDLLERRTSTSLPEVGLRSLAKRFPERVAALALARVNSANYYRHLHRGVRRHLLGLDAEVLAALNTVAWELFEMLPPHRRAEVYAAGPPAKVSSRRAAIRILARFGPPESTELLAEVWHTPQTHPDVRAAIVTAVRGVPLSPAVWEILTGAAGSTAPAEVRALLAAVPQDLPESDRPRFASLVLSACASSDRVIAKDAFEHLAQWVPWAPDALGVIATALADPEFTGPAVFWPRDILKSLVFALLEHAGTLAPVLGRLITLDRDDPDPGSPERDRPARRCVSRIAEDVAAWVQSHPAGDRWPAYEAGLTLAAEPAFLADGAALLVTLAGSHGEPLAEVADLVAARPALAVGLAGRIADTRPDDARLDEIPAVARRLADRGDLAGGLFALSLVKAAGQAKRWEEPWPEALRGLRRHPHPEVADAAYRRVMVR